MASPYRVLLPEPKAKPRALRAPLSALEALDKVGNLLVAHYDAMALIRARESHALNEWLFERRLARIKKGRA
jgi:hypothetical protein